MKIGIKILGCDKNTVESEYIAGLLFRQGHDVMLVEDSIAGCEGVIILTCGFIREARHETEKTLKAMLQGFGKRSLLGVKSPWILVAGCMPQLYLHHLKQHFPGAAGFIGIVSPDEVLKAVDSLSQSQGKEQIIRIVDKPAVTLKKYIKRLQLEKRPYGFLRIADGCDHTCSFCVIPRIKGPYQSVKREILLREARDMVRQGIREINLIAQDTSKYGIDLYGERYTLVHLLKEIASIRGKFWLRLLYLYPTGMTAELIELMAGESKICPYVDIPLQHLDEEVLRLMRRPYSWRRTKALISNVRHAIPDITIRSAFILGYPGETHSRYDTMKKRLRQLALDRVGFFLYSDEKNTLAHEMDNKVSRSIARERLKSLARQQADITLASNMRWIGSEKEILVEAQFPDTNLYLGRSQSEAPEVDGFIIFTADQNIKAGDMVNVIVRRADAYEMYGEMIGTSTKD